MANFPILSKSVTFSKKLGELKREQDDWAEEKENSTDGVRTFAILSIGSLFQGRRGGTNTETLANFLPSMVLI